MEEIVNGINVFREAFAPFADSFIVIGGSACRVVIPEGDIRPRKTTDIDMVLVPQELSAGFVGKFVWLATAARPFPAAASPGSSKVGPSHLDGGFRAPTLALALCSPGRLSLPLGSRRDKPDGSLWRVERSGIPTLSPIPYSP